MGRLVRSDRKARVTQKRTQLKEELFRLNIKDLKNVGRSLESHQDRTSDSLPLKALYLFRRYVN